MENRMLRCTEDLTGASRNDYMENLNGAGWKNLSDGTFVSDESAFDYALDHCTNFVPPGFHKIEWTQEFKDMLVDWFYSCGEWRKEN